MSALDRPWILWAFDPCPDGGWSIQGGFDTEEEATLAAKALHAREVKSFREQVEFDKGEGRKDQRTWDRWCYNRCVVTPGHVFKIDENIV